MAGSSDISSFYRQEKKATAVAKSKNVNGGGGGGVAVGKISSKIGSDVAIASAFLSPTDGHRSATESTKTSAEERLREFDTDMRYGPTVGLTRMERWDRAAALGLCPPSDVEALLLSPSVVSHCLWQSRV